MKNVARILGSLSLLLSLSALADGAIPIKINIQANSSIIIRAQVGEDMALASKIYTCSEPKVDAVAGAQGTELFQLDAGMDSPTLTDSNGNSWVVHCAAKSPGGVPIPPPPLLK